MPTHRNYGTKNEWDITAVDNFREYLRIPSVHPNVDYGPCITFLEKQAENLGLPIKIYYCFPKKPIIILTWTGQEPTLPAVLLNGHMDVVPVFEDKWSYNPFGAEMDKDGNIYARGSQDMKSVSIQYLEAIRKLRNEEITFKRTVHISFVPDEEIGGNEGMKAFVKTEDFKKLNVGFVLDEGAASETNVFKLYFGERTIWQLKIHCPGQSGHGSLLLPNTPAQKVRYILDKFYDFRHQEEKKLKEDPSLTIGDVTTVNATQLEGGVQPNVVPPEMEVVVDCRLAITVNLEEWEETINQWCREAGEGVWIEYISKDPQIAPTKLDDSNPYWTALKESFDKMGLNVTPQISSGGTDSRYIRELGLPAISFSPMNNTPELLHDHNEHLNVKMFLEGIEIYRELIPAVANV